MISKICPKCDAEMKLIPKGVSKVNKKPYNAFWACDARNGGCGHKVSADAIDESPSPTHKTDLEKLVNELLIRVEFLEERISQM